LIIDLDLVGEYTNNTIETRKLIGIKTQGSWSTAISEDFPFNISYVAVKIVAPQSLTVVPGDADLAQALPIGATTTLNAVFTPSNTTNKNVTWSSASTSVATVDASTGVVTGVAAGTALITATSVALPSISGTYTVTVTAETVDVTGVALDLESLSLKMLNTATLAYTVSPATATNRDVTWTSSEEGVATVDEAGTVTPVSAGTTTITIETEDGEFTDECEITVIGFETIPEGYVSLYTLSYMNNGTLAPIAGSDKGAAKDPLTTSVTVPNIFSSNGNKLLGNPSNWNRNHRYVDLSAYDELEVACYFQTEDIGKKINFRYCFSAPSLENAPDVSTASSSTNNRAVEITDNVQKITIDLANDTYDTEDARRLGAIYFSNNSGGEVNFNVDYVALKPTPSLLTWTGNSDGDWNTGANWSSGNVPASANDVLIPATASVSLSGNGVAKILTIEKGAGIDLDAYSIAAAAVKVDYPIANNTWYPIGFPFAVNSFYCKDYEALGYTPADVYPYNPEGYTDLQDFPDDGSFKGDFWLKSYIYQANPFANYVQNMNSGTGYIAKFPAMRFSGDNGGDTITFIAGAQILSAGTAPMPTATYQMFANHNLKPITVTNTGGNYYYKYDAGDGKFKLLGSSGNGNEESATIAPFEAYIAVQESNPQQLRSAFSIEETTEIITLSAQSNDPVVSEEYYNLQGQRIATLHASSLPNGVYIVRQTLQSGNMRVIKVFINKK
jgi:uncharacterized protein YjdB